MKIFTFIAFLGAVSADCTKHIIEQGDTCYQVATNYGVTLEDLYIFNPGVECDSLQIGEHLNLNNECIGDDINEEDLDENEESIEDKEGGPKEFEKIHVVKYGESCCSISDLYNLDIKQLIEMNEHLESWNGCADLIVGQVLIIGDSSKLPFGCIVHVVKESDTCCSIEEKYSIKRTDIESLNVHNPDWLGCAALIVGEYICVLPTQAPEKGCQTYKVISGDTLESVSTEFETTMELLNELNKDDPEWDKGLAKLVGKEICVWKKAHVVSIQSLDKGITKNDKTLDFIKVGYYEYWGSSRKCLKKQAKNINTKRYTHIHYAFAKISQDFKVEIEESYFDDFLDFTRLSGVKKILCFGGSKFNDPGPTKHLMPEMVARHKDEFISNLKVFLETYSLDGFDIDWEYPGIPERGGSPEDAQNFLDFVKQARSTMPNYIISISIPASREKLRHFKLEEMSEYLDYMGVMTYDYHGIWETNLPPDQRFLKPHSSWIDTVSTIEHIKALRVPSKKLLVGIPLYGRSFVQKDPNCFTSNCHFINKKPIPGRCTQERGFMGLGEIREIIRSRKFRKLAYERRSDTNILTYGKNQWVSYLKMQVVESRIEKIKAMQLGGISEWTISMLGDTRSS
ncbi:Killer toxin subunits alpha/beta [Zancudomyces culisetae]|uniref:Killer toxin subunits alpha/beta n=1 Tax=Zancudomyces culisetae TaxID=1213189 RepID=A0A1R1PTG4_ZANCU|nr:Killer toxin subunits alpha/beta [Zancudomyces culisetae]|eukprot:OMH84219.1 Killer toxin subunits alpha/beta [Zancudomyces culisetae]